MGLKEILTTGVVLTGLTAGCSSTPKSGEFNETKLVALPSAPIMMALQGGAYKLEKDIDRSGRWVGVEITKKHILFGKQGSQYIRFPAGAENVGIDNNPIFNDRFSITYDMPDGNRHKREYHIGYGAGKCKLVGEKILD